MSPIRPRYDFDNHLPVPRDHTPPPVHRPVPLPDQQQAVVHQHIHQAPPDRTVQRLALGAGIGGGAVAAGVYFGPLLIAGLTAITVWIVCTTVCIIVLSVIFKDWQKGRGSKDAPAKGGRSK